jgi:hypothetical protein
MADIYGAQDPAAAPAEDIVDLGAAPDPAPADPDVVELREDGEEEGLPPQAVEQPDGSIRLPLKYPVTLKFKTGSTIREERFDALVFHRLNGADMRVIKAAKPEGILAVAMARSTRVHEGKMNAVYDRMDAFDTTAADLVIGHFLGAGQKTGR